MMGSRGSAGEFRLPEMVSTEIVERTGGECHLPSPQHGPIQHAPDSVMPECEGPGFQQLLGTGLQNRRNRDGSEPVLEHKHRYILCA